MASRCSRLMNKASISNIKSAFRSASAPKSAPKFSLPTASPVPRFSFSRCPSELGCVQSLLPLHNAVAAARLWAQVNEGNFLNFVVVYLLDAYLFVICLARYNLEVVIDKRCLTSDSQINLLKVFDIDAI
ncbi:hypothetical protein M8C21_023057 [Ambrosia artemisiifolia]|uniref:Uncharacterized protein n=1 Tax=Ambrosia artemisiifolia TaxID=4212 RepID=A0AAD5BVH5_AMBAR|nr:hypothetical protein M8C21_023057 [Ambrosia artemisiifolia]